MHAGLARTMITLAKTPGRENAVLSSKQIEKIKLVIRCDQVSRMPSSRALDCGGCVQFFNGGEGGWKDLSMNYQSKFLTPCVGSTKS